jgi:tripartite-type tricarboxylate transporter receptor subunit TctC
MTVSVELVKILREAFVRVLKDPEVIAEVNKAKLDMNSCTGEEAQTTMVEALDTQKEVVDRIKTILGK